MYLWCRDASRKWDNIIKTCLLSLGLVISKADPALFYCHDNNNLIGIIAGRVDDFLWSGTKEFETNVVLKLRNTFTIGKENQSIFQYLGINLMENDSKSIMQKTSDQLIKSTIKQTKKIFYCLFF